MALSNIFREPRREITESVVGFAVAGVFIWGDYQFGLWFLDLVGPDPKVPNAVPIGFGMVLGILGAFVLVGLLYLTHSIGDDICNVLQRNGIHLRPRNRQ